MKDAAAAAAVVGSSALWIAEFLQRFWAEVRSRVVAAVVEVGGSPGGRKPRRRGRVIRVAPCRLRTGRLIRRPAASHHHFALIASAALLFSAG